MARAVLCCPCLATPPIRTASHRARSTTRRVNFIDPEQSLLLLKPTMIVPHGAVAAWKRAASIINTSPNGSPKVPGSDQRRAQGCQHGRVSAHRVGEAGFEQQLRAEPLTATAFVRDVTHWAKFDSLTTLLSQ